MRTPAPPHRVPRRPARFALAGVVALLCLEVVLQIGSIVVWLFASPSTADPGAGGPTVLCVGDSYTYGLGSSSSDERSYPAVLQRLLRERLGAAAPRVVNAGWPGQNSRDVLWKIDAQLRTNRPAVVCVLVGLNDTWTRPARLDDADLAASAGDGSGWTLRFRTWRLLQLVLSIGGGPPAAEAARGSDRPAGEATQAADPATPPAVGRAVALAQAGRHDEAVAELERGAADPAQAAQCHQGLVQMLVGLGRRERARASLRWLADAFAQRMTPEVAEAYAVALAAAGERTASLEAARAGAERFPGCSPLWWLQGQALYDLEDLPAAERALDRALATAESAGAKPEWRAMLRRDLARASAARDPCKAVRLLLDSLELDPAFDRCQVVLDGAASHLTPDRVRDCLAAAPLDGPRRELAARLFTGQVVDASGKVTGSYADRKELLGVLEDHLQRIVERCRSAGARPILLTYPLEQSDLAAVHAHVAGAHSVPLVHMLPAFRAELARAPGRDLYIADRHCNDAGYALMAQVLADVVAEQFR